MTVARAYLEIDIVAKAEAKGCVLVELGWAGGVWVWWVCGQDMG